jgi:hypothetical protein
VTATVAIEIAGIVLLAACFIPVIRAEFRGEGVFRSEDDE